MCVRERERERERVQREAGCEFQRDGHTQPLSYATNSHSGAAPPSLVAQVNKQLSVAYELGSSPLEVESTRDGLTGLYSRLEVESRLYDLASGALVLAQRFAVPAVPASAAVALREPMAWPPSATAANQTLLVRMQLLAAGAQWAEWAACGASEASWERQLLPRGEGREARRRLLACNQYWLRGPQEEQSYADLAALRRAPRTVVATAEAVRVGGGRLGFTVRLNASAGGGDAETAVAFSLQLQLVVTHRGAVDADSDGDGRVLPVDWSDNYITLLPGEQALVRGGCDVKALQAHARRVGLAGEAVVAVVVDGWNVRQRVVELLPLNDARVLGHARAAFGDS